MLNKTVVIVGSHSETRNNVPWDDETKDIWALNEAPNSLAIDEEKAARYELDVEQIDKLRDGETIKVKGMSLTLHNIAYYWVRRWTAGFQIHNEAVFKNPLNHNDPLHYEWLQEDHERPIYMQEKYEKIPNSMQYPLDEICEKYLGKIKIIDEDGNLIDFRFFTSTFPYALALAIHLGYETIEIYGVELGNGTEYIYQRTCYTLWVGVASQHANVELHCGRQIFDYPLYGFEGDKIALDQEYFEHDFERHNEEFTILEREQAQMQKSIIEMMRLKQYKMVGELIVDRQKLCTRQGLLSGKIAEAERYKNKHIVIELETKKPATLHRDEYELRAGNTVEKVDLLHAEMWNSSGKTELSWVAWKQHDKQPPELQKQAADQLMTFQLAQMKKAFEFGQQKGVYDYNVGCMMEFDKRMQAAGGLKAAGAFDVG